MKIVSKFKDYYDGLRAMDRDDDPVYARFTRIINVNGVGDTDDEVADRHAAQPLWTGATTVNPSYYIPYPRGVIGFCGRLFFFFDVRGTCCWTYAQLVHAVAQEVANGDLAVRPRDLDRALDNAEREWTLLERTCSDDPFIHFRAPVLLRRDHEIVVNPQLRPIGFASQVDSYNAWQELSMFLGNNMVAANRVEPRPVSDELKAEAKGFDRKTSFRNQKNRPKANRSDW